MRLDAFLVKQGKVASRGRARRAILKGQVKIDGKLVTKPSIQVGYNNEIEVKENIDVPAGYLKLKDIQELTGIIQPDDIVLDLGSSAGGFLLFASEIAAQVIGIEYSADFMPLLEEMEASHGNITVIRGDVFTMPLAAISDRPVDVILNDITVEPEDSIRVLERVMPLLKPGGRVLQVLKLSSKSGLEACINSIQRLRLAVHRIIEPEKREIYVIAVHNENSEAIE